MTNMSECLLQIDLPGISKLRSGKVREVFDLGEHLLFVATDRISAFDCILPNGIPHKGKVLNQISAYWFRKTNNVVINHFRGDDVEAYPEILQPYKDLLRGRSMIVQKLEPLPVECVVRGYLTGSAWKEYKDNGTVCGEDMPPGLTEYGLLPQPIFTPATKNDHGHDENISYDRMCEIIGYEQSEKLRDASLIVYKEAQKALSSKGILLADTKFEYGLQAGETILMDECLTPDSSRFWLRKDFKPSQQPPSPMDKQFVRNYLETCGWDKTPPAPPLPEDVVARTSELYLSAFKMVTGTDLVI